MGAMGSFTSGYRIRSHLSSTYYSRYFFSEDGDRNCTANRFMWEHLEPSEKVGHSNAKSTFA